MEIREQLQRTLGNAYTLERELGGGGMSQVFVAEETALGRKVVVKVLPPGRTGDVNIERFKREIQVAARLQHAHIVPVLTAGETNGLPFYTMPYVEGESLRARLAKGPLSTAETVNILRDVARALAYAHERGVVHRDIKPDNVMLSGGSAVVTDFGIAKAISAARDIPDATLTQAGTSLGTPAYMAPEQAAGDPSTDHRADLYALGCMAYEMLIGAPPFVEKSPQLLLAAHMAKDAEPISARRTDVPAALAALVAQCLAKDPGARPTSAAEVTRVLETTSADAFGSMPRILVGGSGMLLRTLGMYAIAFLAVGLIAKAAVSAIGLPNWVFPGALIVMALGLPAILLTGYVQSVVRRVAGATPTYTPGGSQQQTNHGTLATLALKASPHMSWRRTQMGGVYAVSGFVLLVGVFMLLRALGIGPAGSLLAAGTFDAQNPVLVTDFSVTNADSALGKVLSDATKTTLNDSRVIRLLPPEAIAAALARMERPRTSTMNLALARELAGRNAINAIVDGNITGVGGSGYIVTLRLVTADSLKELASFIESAKDAPGLIEAVDRLSRALRGRIGESLKAVNATPSLAQVTTASFEALRKYTEADRAELVGGDRPRAIRLLQETVAIDTTFAEAWRKLGILYRNAGRSRELIDTALTAAYRHRNRASPHERAMIEAAYFSTPGPNRDRAKGIAAYEELLRLGDSTAPANNIAIALNTRREFARAETLYRAAIRLNPELGRLAVPNLYFALVIQNKIAAAESLLGEHRERFPTNATLRRGPVSLLYVKGDVPGYRRAVDSVRTKGDSLDRMWAKTQTAELALLDGRFREFYRIWNELGPIDPKDHRARLNAVSSIPSQYKGTFYGKTARDSLIRELESQIAALQAQDGTDVHLPYFNIIEPLAYLGRPDRARVWLARYDAEVKNDTVRARSERPARQRVEATILSAEGKTLEAVALFRQADRLPDGPVNNCLSCLPTWLAFTFNEGGMVDSAIVYLQQALTIHDPLRITDWRDPFMIPEFNRMLGEAYEKKGDRVKAVEHYRKVIDQWKNADPELQVIVEELRGRVRRLADNETVKR